MTKEKGTAIETNKKNALMKLFGNNVSFDYEIPLNQIELFQLSSLPKNILEHMEFLTSIDISNCNLSIIPNAISELPLRKLNISHNILTEIPDCLFTSLYRIAYLDISYNLIQEFLAPNCLLSLAILKINNNKLKTIPSWIWESSIRLKELDLSNNNFDMKSYGIMYKTFLSTSRLTWLSVTDCNFSNSDAFILSRIPNLIYLNIGNNNYLNKSAHNCWDIPISKLNCKNNLKIIIASNLYLSALPDNINELTALTCINLAHNNLHWLPDTFCSLKNLRICDISNNVLSYFPTSFRQLSSLVELYLANNNFTILPDFIKELTSLQVLDLYNNNLENIDLQLINNMFEIDFDFNYVDCDPDLVFNKKMKLRKRLGIIRADGCKVKSLTNVHTDTDSGASTKSCDINDFSSEDEDIDQYYNAKDAKSNSSAEIWDDTNYLDDNFVPSPLSVSSCLEKLQLSSNNLYDLYEIFKDAD